MCFPEQAGEGGGREGKGGGEGGKVGMGKVGIWKGEGDG